MTSHRMQKQLLIVMAEALASVGLCACTSAAYQRSTYDTIDAQMVAAARTAAPATDAAVSNALLPPVATLAEQLPKARQAVEERFNVAFNNVPAQQFFNSIVLGTRYNMLVHPEVAGNISANLKDVTMTETLDAVRDMYGYDYRIEGNRISIRPLTMQSRMFQVNYLVGSRKGGSSLRVMSTSVSSVGTVGQGTQTGQLNQTNPNQNSGQMGIGTSPPSDSTSVSMNSTSDFWVELKASLEAIVGAGVKEGGRSVVVSPQSGVLVVRAMPDELRSVENYLKAAQLSVDRQVILEAKILEVELNDSFQAGINWAAFGHVFGGDNNRLTTGFASPGAVLTPLPPGGAAPSPLTNGSGLVATAGSRLANTAAGSLFGLAFQTSNFAALLSFLDSQGTVHVLSSPRVTAMNNEKAVLKIGTDEFFVTGVSTVTNTSASGNVTSPNLTLSPFFSGVVLDVTPQIDDKGNILLHVHPSVSQVSTVNKTVDLGSAGTINLPLAASATSEIDSMVRGQNGMVFAIGGLMRLGSTGSREQIPGLGDIPVLGALFGNRNYANQKRELVVLIKPTIVEGVNSWNQNLLESTRRIEELDPAGRRSK
jgi:MSHA biogenesis protein MshL